MKITTWNINGIRARIEGALAYAKGISGLAGVVAVIGEDMGMWGRVSIAKESSDDRIVLRLT